MNASISKIYLHLVGNKTNDQQLILSEKPLELEEELAQFISDSFFDRFATSYESYHFTHPTSLEFNEIYNFATHLFENQEELKQVSINMAKHLYEVTDHPNVKQGELYIAQFKGCSYDNKLVDAIGIFKTEVKNDFLEVISASETDIQVLHKKGIDLRKIEKGCLIYGMYKDRGYEVRIFDNQNRGGDAQYWKGDFLGLEATANEYKQTNEFLGIAKNYISKQLGEEFEVNRTDQIDLLNKSVDYFKSRESFNKDEFEEEVFRDQEVIESFRGFDNNYRKEHEIELQDSFDISTPAVKKQARVFKSVLKLDKNFHIYIHGDKSKIEKGIESDGRKYYKVYFDEEL